MKTTYTLVSIFFTLMFLPNTFSQAGREPQLPEGAKTRIEVSGRITGNIQFSPDGKELAVSSSMGIWLYNVRNGAEVALLSGHEKNVQAIAYAPDGKMLASAGIDGTIRLWNLKMGESMATLTGHNASVSSVAFSPDGKQLVSGGAGGTVRLWSIRTQQQIWSADTPQKQMLAEEQKLPLPGVFRTNKPTRPFRSPFEILGLRWVLAVAYSSDGKTLASSGSTDGTIQLWNAANGAHIRTLKGHTEKVNTLAVSPDGKTLVSGSADDTLRMWDIATGNLKRKLSGHSNDVRSVVFSRDGKILASGSADASVRLWDAGTGRFLPTLRGHFWKIRAVAVSPDGKTVLSADDDTILLWDWKKLAKTQ